MDSETIFATVLLLCAGGYFLLGFSLVNAGRRPGGVTIGIIYSVIGIWVLGGGVELVAQNEHIFSLGRTGHFVGTAFLPVLAIICFREFTGKATPGYLVLLLSLVPFVTVALAASNASHGLVWSEPFANAQGEFLTRPESWGPWFVWAHAPYSYALIIVAIMTLLTHRSAVARTYRKGLALLAAVSALPLLATIAYTLGIGPDTMSIVPFVFAVLLPANVWLMTGGRVVGNTPLAYETVFQNMLDPVIVLDDQDRIVGLNRRAEELLGLREQDALQTRLDAVFGLGSTGVFEALTTSEPRKLVTQSGRFLHVQASPIEQGGRGLAHGKVLMFRDVSDVEHAQSEVRKSELLLRTLVDHSVNGIVRLRWTEASEIEPRQLQCIFANAAAGRFLDVHTERLLERNANSILELACSGMNEAELAPVLAAFSESVVEGSGLDTEVRQGSGSSARWLRMICEPVGEDIAVTFIDVTDSKAKQHQAESMASSDPLTGLLNRRGFEHRASERMTESNDDAVGALLFIDLNDFKQINDRCGHAVGDQLLTIAAKRLQKSLRPGDIIGRPGGDEFVALVPDVSRYKAGKLAARLAVSLEEPYRVGDEVLQCSASIGLAHYPDNANTLTGLMREADEAMYRAKARNRDVGEFGFASRLEKAV